MRHSHSSLYRRPGFTLVELLIVVAIISILAAIAVPNLRLATRRTHTSACAANLKTIATALAMYRVDWGALPLADGEAGAHDSRTQTKFGFGPAGNGLWSAVPNVLVESRYLGDRKALFCPSLRKRHVDRAEHLRYAYNAGAKDSGRFLGGTGGTPIDGAGATGGNQWIARCLFINSKAFAPQRYIAFPHGPDADPGNGVWGDENILWNSLGVKREPGDKP